MTPDMIVLSLAGLAAAFLIILLIRTEIEHRRATKAQDEKTKRLNPHGITR